MNRYRYAMAVAFGIAFATVALGAQRSGDCSQASSEQLGTNDRPPSTSSPAGLRRDPEGRPAVCATRLSEALNVDGRLDEDVYHNVVPISHFVQTVPNEGAPASEKTEAWVMYDDHSIYVSARCWDSAPPEKWVVNEMRRDTSQIRQNDTFGVSFDTFYDRRNGFVMYTNPIGGRADYAVTDEVANFDWNPVWEVRTGRFDGGWTVEMQIPFKSLRYRSGSEQVWGIQLRRVVRHKNEWTYLSLVPASAAGPYGFTRVSFGGTLMNLKLPPARSNIELKPYAISRVTSDHTKNPAVTNDLRSDFGLDAKYGITANLTADFTYNTDFAQVEVDEQQINLTRFSLLFPEKREFFLEGRGLFDFGRGTGSGDSDGTVPMVFFTRRIGLEGGATVPIDFGARLTEKAGKYGIGALNIQAGGEPQLSVQPTNFTVIRVKRDVLRRSAIGAIFTNRSQSVVADRGTNQAYGIDGTLSFYENLNLSGYFARTRTPGLEGDDTSHLAKFTYTGDRYGLQLDRLAVGNHFNPEVGFLRRRDFERTFALARFSPRPRAIKSVRKFTAEASLEYIVSGAGALESRRQVGRFITEFESSDQITMEGTNNYELLVEPFRLGQNLTIPPGGYRFSDISLSYFLGSQHRGSGTLTVQRGSFYGGTITTLGFLSGQIGITPRLMLEPSLSSTRIDLPHGKLTTNLIQTRTDYSFTNRMFVSALVQFNSADRTLGGNVRFRWEYRPGSELFVVYTDERKTIGSRFPLQNRAFVVKINWLFRF